MFVMNKNVHHNRKEYKKGFVIEESDDGFADLKKAGHVEEAVKADGHVDGVEAFKKYQGKAEAKAEAAEPEAQAEGENEDAEEGGKPARNRRR